MINWIQKIGLTNFGYLIAFLVLLIFVPDNRILGTKEFILGALIGIFVYINFNYILKQFK